ncbi:MAG: Clostripain, partial [Acidobacteria bacterium]|nr:Clostripain [Acidobacteriota bacterium]
MSYPSDPSSAPPSLPPASRAGSRVPLWLPIAAGIAVVAVATLVVVMLAGDNTKSATTTSTVVAGSTTTTTAPTTTTTAPTTTTTTSGQAAGGSWTVLVYGLGDNNLEADLLDDLDEMAAVPAGALEFVALVDRTPDYTDQAVTGIGDWDGAKVIAITPGTFTEEADLGELDLGDPQVLTDFVTRGIQDHPADHYALILWDHGSIAGVGSDESSGDGLDVPEIAAAVRAGLDAAGTARLDLLGFDACLMGAFEVASAMPGLAEYMVASEEVEPNDGWDYGAFDLIAAQPDTVTARSLGEEVVSRYIATSGPSDPTVTMSLLDLTAVPDLVAALDGLNGAVAPQMATFAPEIGRGRNNAPSFGGSPVPEEDFYMVDLGDLLRRLGNQEPPLGDAATAALEVFDRVVVSSAAGEAASAATGMAIHFPPYSDYYYENWYRAIEAPVWPDFLDAYYSAGAEIPADKRPSFAPIDNQASFYFDEYGLSVEATF